jgi:hypothetical protein
MASHLETELGKPGIIIKSFNESQVAEAVKSVLQNLVPKEGRKKKKIRLINLM